MNNTTSVLIGVGFAAVFASIIIYSLYTNKKRKDANWSGVVIDKAVQEIVERPNQTQQNGVAVGGINFSNSQPAVTHNYSITVRPDTGGEPFKWPISSGMYEQVSIGDTLRKQPGTQIPEIVQKAAIATAPAAATLPTNPLQ